jgi:alpha-D-xyloside xylohydrolase
MFRRLNRRTYTLVRANFVGAQAYASCIFSDYFDFKGYIRALCTSGFTGVLWCPEVRKDSIDSQEFVRRSQVTFFAPMAMINAWHDAQVPWEWGDQAEAIFKKYDHLRMRLLPYVYAQFRQAGKTGVPLVRGLVVDFPEDKETYAIDDQFMFGDALMVAPVIRGESRKVHFPPGTWTDVWTGEKTAGGCTKEVKAPLDTLPLYVRDGAIIPMGPVMNHVAEREVTDLEIHLYPGPQPRRLTLYDDDGVTFDYEKGSYWEVPIELAADGQGISAKLLPPIGSYRSPIRTLDLVCHDGKEPPPRKQLDTSALAKKAQTIRFDR